jgi:hypothetical protein
VRFGDVAAPSPPYGAAAEALGLAGVSMLTDPITGAVEDNIPPPDDPDWAPF